MAPACRKYWALKWYDRVPRADSRQRLGIPSPEEIILKRQLRWFGHVVRMPDDRLPRQVLYGELSAGDRSAGGHKKRYKDNIKRTMKHFHIDPQRAESDASERCGWARQVTVGAAAFADDYAAAAAERRTRRHTLEVAAVSTAVRAAVAAHRWPVCGATEEPTREKGELILVYGGASSSKTMDFLKQKL